MTGKIHLSYLILLFPILILNQNSGNTLLYNGIFEEEPNVDSIITLKE